MKKKLLSLTARTAAITLAFLALPLSAPAQANSLVDTDGDRIPDVWETQGYDANRDGRIDIDFPAMGADPYRKDIFVEMDWMPRGDGGIELAPVEDLDRIVDIFANYPIRNPDGSTGISLHLDAGSARGQKYNLGGGNQVPYSRLTNALNGLQYIKDSGNFDPARRGVFHYMIWGDLYSNGSSSGIARFPGMDFLVTVGQTNYGRASSDIRVGTFVHELGHNLGLAHGGEDNYNYKPNYLSIMNYAYQFTGVPKQSGPNYFGYSNREGMTIDENAVRESSGLGAVSAGYSYSNERFSLYRAVAHKNLDFNRNGMIDSSFLRMDLNNDNRLSTLAAPDDLANLRFQSQVYSSAGLSLNPVEEESQDAPNELTAEDARALKLIP